MFGESVLFIGTCGLLGVGGTKDMQTINHKYFILSDVKHNTIPPIFVRGCKLQAGPFKSLELFVKADMLIP